MTRNKSILLLISIGLVMILATAMHYQVNNKNTHARGVTKSPIGQMPPQGTQMPPQGMGAAGGSTGMAMSKLFGENADPALAQKAGELMQALQTNQNDPEVSIELALLFQQVGDYEAMLNFANRAAALAPAQAKTAYLKAIAHSQLGQVNEAIAEFERSLSIEDLAESHYNLGILLMNKGDAKHAKDHFNLALKSANITEDLKNVVNQALKGL